MVASINYALTHIILYGLVVLVAASCSIPASTAATGPVRLAIVVLALMSYSSMVPISTRPVAIVGTAGGQSAALPAPPANNPGD